MLEGGISKLDPPPITSVCVHSDLPIFPVSLNLAHVNTSSIFKFFSSSFSLSFSQNITKKVRTPFWNSKLPLFLSQHNLGTLYPICTRFNKNVYLHATANLLVLKSTGQPLWFLKGRAKISLIIETYLVLSSRLFFLRSTIFSPLLYT